MVTRPRAAPARRSGSPPKHHTPARRVPPDERRRQLIDVAARIVTERGVEHVQITEVAAQAQVSRPLVYRLFPTRQALVRAMLEDFGAHLGEAFRAALLRAMPADADSMAGAFVEASCDAIEAKGAGPWRLLDGGGAEPELARLGRATLRALLEPWQDRLAAITGRSPRRNANVLWILVAAGRASLDGWIDGHLSRREAVEDGTRTVGALLRAFSVAQDADPRATR